MSMPDYLNYSHNPYHGTMLVAAKGKKLEIASVYLYKATKGKGEYKFPELPYTEENAMLCLLVAKELNAKESVKHVW